MKEKKIVKKGKIELILKEKFSFYGIVTLIILVFYVFFIGYYLYDANKIIKYIYKDIENKRIYNEFIKSEIIKIKDQKINRIYSYDLETDNSITKFVNSSVSFNDKSYVPENLIGMKGTHIIDIKGNGALRVEALIALIELDKSFYDTFNENIKVVSSYRSYNYQQTIKNGGCPDNLCAKAGFSEHQSGLVIDLWETTTNNEFLSNSTLKKYFEWLNNNAHKYGFTNTYQKGLDIDGYEIEPWHWRYLGPELATYLKDNNMTIAEFYNNK